MIEKLYIWLTPKGDYYHKVVKGTYKYNSVGDINQYNHKLVYIIDLDKFMSDKYYKSHGYKKKVNYRKMLINDIIRLLEKIR